MRCVPELTASSPRAEARTIAAALLEAADVVEAADVLEGVW